jgi:rRNA processing protein Gar1
MGDTVRSGRASIKNLTLVAEFMHRVGQYVVARADPKAVPRIGAPVYDEKGRKMGIVSDVFGPVRAPMILVKGKRSDKYFARPSDLLGMKGVGIHA